MDIRVDAKRALVTGANSGIGQAIAMALAGSGASVIVNYVTHPESATDTVSRIQSQGGKAHAYMADVSDPAAVAGMFTEADRLLGGVDILVNNAGIYGVRALGWEADLTAWQKVMDINLFGAFHCAREALRRMTAQKAGVVLTMTSVHETIAWGGYSAYTTA